MYLCIIYILNEWMNEEGIQSTECRLVWYCICMRFDLCIGISVGKWTCAYLTRKWNLDFSNSIQHSNIINHLQLKESRSLARTHSSAGSLVEIAHETFYSLVCIQTISAIEYFNKWSFKINIPTSFSPSFKFSLSYFLWGTINSMLFLFVSFQRSNSI